MGFTGIFHGIHQHEPTITGGTGGLFSCWLMMLPNTVKNKGPVFRKHRIPSLAWLYCFASLWPFWKKMLFAECWHAMSRISFVISICWLLKYAFVVSGSWFSHSRIETQVWFLHAPFCWHRTSGSKFPDFVDAFLATLSQRCGHGFGSPILMVSAPPLLYAYRRKSMENS